MDILGFISALFLFCSLIAFLVVIFLIGFDDLKKQRDLKERILKCVESYEKLFMIDFIDSLMKSRENNFDPTYKDDEVSDNE